MTLHLIQRCTLRNEKTDKSKVTGFDSIFSLDYMGSAEFEFGAVPASLKLVASNLPKYEVFPAKEFKAKSGEGIFLLASSKDAVANILDTLRACNAEPNHDRTKHYFQERSYFKQMLANEKHYYEPNGIRNTVLWWDLNEHWFASFGKPTMELLQLGMTKLRERWLKEGKISG